MLSPVRLGGFKILSDVTRFQVALPKKSGISLSHLFDHFVQEKINFPYVSFVQDKQLWNVTLLVENSTAGKIRRLTAETLGKIVVCEADSAILSVFPHKNKPEIPALLLEALGRQGALPRALAQSSSAVSAVINAELAGKASEALFGPFNFSAYRSPEDWKLTQKGKEKLYKEVVASYQEKKPKVYGLEYQPQQILYLVRIPLQNLSLAGLVLKDFVRQGGLFNFLTAGICQDEREIHFLLCLPRHQRQIFTPLIKKNIPEATAAEIGSAARFTMNGPHFGDRHGIAYKLFTALEQAGVDLLGLGCSIASITGVVASDSIEATTAAIRTCFEVPCVIDRNFHS